MNNYEDAGTNNNRFHFLGVAVVGASIATVLSFHSSTSIAQNSNSTPSYEPQGAITTKQREWVPELPVRLIIPAIDVDAGVEYIGISLNGSSEVPVPSDFNDVGWYQSGTRPGIRGSAVIAGHSHGKNIAEGVFFKLHTLEVGDEIVIMSAERIEDIFGVVKIETYDYETPLEDVFVSTDGKKRLNLITVNGDWLPEKKIMDKRVVVFTELLTDVE